MISPEDLGLVSASKRPPRSAPSPSLADGLSFHERVAAFEQSLVLGALEEANGNQAEAARRLGLAYHQYRYLLRKLRPDASAAAGTEPTNGTLQR